MLLAYDYIKWLSIKTENKFVIAWRLGESRLEMGANVHGFISLYSFLLMKYFSKVTEVSRWHRTSYWGGEQGIPLYPPICLFMYLVVRPHADDAANPNCLSKFYFF